MECAAAVMDVMSGSMMPGMFAWTLLVVGFLVVGVTWLVRRGRAPAQEDKGAAPQVEQVADPAYEILRRRYAAGEIDEDEYLLRLSGLSQR